LGDKAPRTPRGERTVRAILDAAAQEFGTRGFTATAITDITARAGVATGSFYTWFDSKEAVFRALVADLSEQVRDRVAPAVLAAPNGLAAEAAGMAEYLAFVRDHAVIYRIIDEAEFVAPDAHRAHYETTAARITARLRAAADRGEIRADVCEAHAWAIMGMNVFLGLRYGVWGDDPDAARAAADLLAHGLSPQPGPPTA
jgi:AcrR family transcriptional regulator